MTPDLYAIRRDAIAGSTPRLAIDAGQIRDFVGALFCHASEGQTVSLRAFPDQRDGAPVLIRSAKINGAGIALVIEMATRAAQDAADHEEPAVFCPPIAGFNNATNPWKATEKDLQEAFALSVECDAKPSEARQTLERLLGPATVVVSSGGEFSNPDTGELEPKLHLHWRLTEPASGEDLARLKRARRYATALVGGDPTNVPMVHPIRWPGSWHRKGTPRLASIVTLTSTAELDLGETLDKLEEATRDLPSLKPRLVSLGANHEGDGRELADLVRGIVSGESLHPSLVPIAARLIGSGTPPGTVVNILRGLMEGTPEATRDQRWWARYADIPRTVSTAQGKFGRAEVDLSTIAASAPERALERSFPDELTRVPGLVGAIASWINATARYPQPALALGAALTLVGTAAGRRVAGPTNSGTHLYILALAPTGAGKNHASKMARALLRGAGLGHHIGTGQFISMTSVYDEVAEEPLRACFQDEFGSWLARVNSSGSGGYEKAISGVLRTLWGASFETFEPPRWASSSGKKLAPIHAPALSLYGTSVPEEFFTALQSADVLNGFLNRFLLIAADSKPEEVEPELPEFELPERLLAGLKAVAGGTVLTAATLHQGKVDQPEIKVDWAGTEVRLSAKAWRRELEARETDAAFYTRTYEMALRLATIRAIGIKSTGITGPRIDQDGWDWARQVALWSATRMVADARMHMVENENQRQSKMVERIIREAGKLSRSELVRKIDGKLTPRVLDDILKNLEQAETIQSGDWERAPGARGPKPVGYVYVAETVREGVH